MKIRIAGISKESLVDGPGIRYVIFAQGCLHNCIGCHNPSTHPLDGGYLVDINEIYNDIISNKFIDGVTFSGGEPFLQVNEFTEIAKKLKEKNFHIISYTGYLFEDIIKDKEKSRLLNYIDILIDGPFIISKKTLKKAFVGSYNQRVIDVKSSIELGRVIEVKW